MKAAGVNLFPEADSKKYVSISEKVRTECLFKGIYIYSCDNKPLHNVFKLIDVLKPSDQPFNSPASFNVICIAGIQFAYINCC